MGLFGASGQKMTSRARDMASPIYVVGTVQCDGETVVKVSLNCNFLLLRDVHVGFMCLAKRCD